MKMAQLALCNWQLLSWLALFMSVIIPTGTSYDYAILILILFFNLKKGADELFMVKRTMLNKTTELQCFYNGPQETSVGLSWVLPPTVSTFIESLYFLPNPSFLN